MRTCKGDMVLAPREDSIPSPSSDPRNTDTAHLSRLQTKAFEFCITSAGRGFFHVRVSEGLGPTKCSTRRCKFLSGDRPNVGSTFSYRLSPRISARRDRSLGRLRFSIRTWYAAKSSDTAATLTIKGRMIFRVARIVVLNWKCQKWAARAGCWAASNETPVTGPLRV
jgi:hypothetical protein